MTAIVSLSVVMGLPPAMDNLLSLITVTNIFAQAARYKGRNDAMGHLKVLINASKTFNLYKTLIECPESMI